MVKYRYLLLLVFLISFGSAGLEVGLIGRDGSNSIGLDLNLNPLEINQGGNYSINVNYSGFSNYWITDIGTARTPNSTQFNIVSEVLSLDELWVDSLWCRLTGCTMTNDITFNTGSINNVTNITLVNSIKDSDSESRMYFDADGAFVIEA